jgi:type IV fimbrial biogenesis protein FimT
MNSRRLVDRGQGFTLVELLVILAMIGIVMLIGVPTFQQLIHRTKIESITRETAKLMNLARFESIKRGVPVVVQIGPDGNQVFSFVDVHGGLDPTLPSDGLFAAIPGAVARTTDYALGRLELPVGVSFSFQALTGEDSVDGFVNSGIPDPPDGMAIFQSDGSVLDSGAVRFGDQRGNFLEARIDPPGTARIQVRKWDDTDSAWYAFGEGGKPWQWK